MEAFLIGWSIWSLDGPSSTGFGYKIIIFFFCDLQDKWAKNLYLASVCYGRTVSWCSDVGPTFSYSSCFRWSWDRWH